MISFLSTKMVQNFTGPDWNYVSIKLNSNSLLWTKTIYFYPNLSVIFLKFWFIGILITEIGKNMMLVNSSNQKSNKQTERLESIKRVHDRDDSKFTNCMEDYLEVISELVELQKARQLIHLYQQKVSLL